MWMYIHVTLVPFIEAAGELKDEARRSTP